MKVTKRIVSVLLALLLVFGNVSLLANAAASDVVKIRFEYYRDDGTGNWIKTNKIARGDTVKARLFINTTFNHSSFFLFFSYPKDFMSHEYSHLEKDPANSLIAYLPMNTENSQVKQYDYQLNVVSDSVLIKEQLIDDGGGEYVPYLTEAFFEKNRFFTSKSEPFDPTFALDGSDWVGEYQFTVNEDATGDGYVFVPKEAIMAPGEQEAAVTYIFKDVNGKRTGSMNEAFTWDVETPTSLTADSKLTLDNTITFDANGGKLGSQSSVSSTGYIGETIAAENVPSEPTPPGGKLFVGWVDASVENPSESDVVDPATVVYDYEATTYKALYKSADKVVTVNANYTDKNGVAQTATKDFETKAGNKVMIVDSLPEVQEENVTYILKSALPSVEHYELDTANTPAENFVLGSVSADSDAIMNLTYKPVDYTATFKPDNGTEATTVTKAYYSEITAPAAPVKDGFRFTGWKLDGAETVIEAGAKFNIEGNVSYTAQYVSASTTVALKVKYNDLANGGVEKTVSHATIDTIAGNTVTLSAADEGADKTTYYLIENLPVIEHYEYDAENTVTSVTATADGKAELVVAYKPVKYTATFEGAQSFENVDYYTEITAPAGPVVAGKTFTGWKLDGAETVIAAGAKFNIAGNATYKAQYDDVVYNATYSFTGDEIPEDAVVPSATSGIKGAEVTLPEVTPITGWTFNGWTVTGATETDGKYYYNTSNVTVKGSWTHNIYTATYWLDEAKTEQYDVQEYYFGDMIDLLDAPTESELPNGKEFVEWDCGYVTMPAQNIDIVASTQDIQYTVTITIPENDPITYPAFYGDEITAEDLAEYEEIEGYTFNKWVINGRDASLPYQIIGNTGVRGDFTKNKWDLYFWASEEDYNAFIGGDNTVTPVKHVEDVEYDSPIDTLTPVAPTKEGNEFVMWDTEPTTMEDNDMHFYAVWTLKSYTVIWDNDGTKTTETYEYGETLTPPAVDPKTGYTHKGWSGYTDGMTMPDGPDTVTYTAVWEANKYNATFNANDGAFEDGELSKTIEVAFDSDIVFTEVPTRAGYTFGGWDPAVGKMDDVNGKTFNAIWNAEGDIAYTIETYIMGTDGSYGAPSTATKSGATDAPVSITPEAKEGFTVDTENSVLEGTIAADGTTTLVVKYIRNQYTLKTVVDGEETSSNTYYYDAAVSIETPSKTGYTFSGWDKSITKMPANDETLSGTFTVNTHDVIYMVDGIEYDRVEDVAYDTPVTVMDNPTKTGYTFSGWDTEDFTMPDADVTISGTFTVNKHNVIYMVDGEEYRKVENVAYDTSVTVIDEPTREGYTFSGWDKEDFTMPDEDVTISGTFTVNKYDVVYVVDGVEYDRTYDVAYGTRVTAIDAPTREGYTFSGWDRESFMMPDEEVVIRGTFTVNTHDVIYMVDGVEYDRVEDVAYGTTVTVIDAPEKTGYTFSGWNAEEFAMPDEDVTISGTFTVNKYDVIYMVDGFEYDRVEDVAYDTDVTIIDDPTKDGCSFSGWTINGSPAEDFKMPDNDVTIVGSFSNNSYTVTYYKDQDKSAIEYTYTGDYGQQYNVPVDPTKEGHKFLGWVNMADGSAAGLPEAGSITTVPINGAEYYATWETLKYKLIYNAGTNATFSDSATTKSFDVLYGTAKSDWQVPEETVSRPGYTFKGWDLASAPATMGAAPVRVNAIWEAIPYTVTWNNGSAEPVVNTYNYGEEIIAPDIEEREGWTFIGWLEADGETYFSDGDLMGDKNLVYTAEWEGNSGVTYTVYRYFAPVTGDSWMDAADAEAKYGKAGSTALTGTAGETASVDSSAEAVEGFHIDTANSVLSAEIKGDGTTALVIYYLRDKVKVTVSDPDGETYFDEEVDYEEEIDIPDPEKEGHDFIRWEDEDGNPVQFPMKAPSDDIVINPVFDKKSYTITFKDDEGKVISGPTEIKYGDTIVAPEDPVKEGYRFAYWQDADTKAVMPSTMPAKNATYVAYFTAGEDTTYYIQVYMMDTNGNYTMASQTIATGTTGDPISIIPGDVTGCTYDATLSELTGTITADGKATLKVYYARNKFTVTFKSGDGAFAEGATVVGPTDVYYGAAIPVPAEPVRSGYEFNGWDIEVPATMPANSLVFNATWTEAEYTITYVVNGTKSTVSYKYGADVAQPDDPVVDGMTFVKWDSVIPAKMPAENLVIVAEFKVAVYKATFMVDGVAYDQFMVSHGDTIPVPAENPTKEFYTFKEWTNMPEDGKMPAHDIEIIATFERVPVKLIPMAGSETVINDEITAIYGIGLYATEATLRSTYLDVEGDGYFTVEPSKNTSSSRGAPCGTGTVIKLYDNNDPSEPLETYTIVVFGDLDGDARISITDYTQAYAEYDMSTSWSDPTSEDYDFYKTMAADFDGDSMISQGEAASIERYVLGTVDIDQTKGKVDRSL